MRFVNGCSNEETEEENNNNNNTSTSASASTSEKFTNGVFDEKGGLERTWMFQSNVNIADPSEKKEAAKALLFQERDLEIDKDLDSWRDVHYHPQELVRHFCIDSDDSWYSYHRQLEFGTLGLNKLEIDPETQQIISTIETRDLRKEDEAKQEIFDEEFERKEKEYEQQIKNNNNNRNNNKNDDADENQEDCPPPSSSSSSSSSLPSSKYPLPPRQVYKTRGFNTLPGEGDFELRHDEYPYVFHDHDDVYIPRSSFARIRSETPDVDKYMFDTLFNFTDDQIMLHRAKIGREFYQKTGVPRPEYYLAPDAAIVPVKLFNIVSSSSNNNNNTHDNNDENQTPLHQDAAAADTAATTFSSSSAFLGINNNTSSSNNKRNDVPFYDPSSLPISQENRDKLFLAFSSPSFTSSSTFPTSTASAASAASSTSSSPCPTGFPFVGSLNMYGETYIEDIPLVRRDCQDLYNYKKNMNRSIEFYDLLNLQVNSSRFGHKPAEGNEFPIASIAAMRYASRKNKEVYTAREDWLTVGGSGAEKLFGERYASMNEKYTVWSPFSRFYHEYLDSPTIAWNVAFASSRSFINFHRQLNGPLLQRVISEFMTFIPLSLHIRFYRILKVDAGEEASLISYPLLKNRVPVPSFASSIGIYNDEDEDDKNKDDKNNEDYYTHGGRPMKFVPFVFPDPWRPYVCDVTGETYIDWKGHGLHIFYYVMKANLKAPADLQIDSKFTEEFFQNISRGTLFKLFPDEEKEQTFEDLLEKKMKKKNKSSSTSSNNNNNNNHDQQDQLQQDAAPILENNNMMKNHQQSSSCSATANATATTIAARYARGKKLIKQNKLLRQQHFPYLQQYSREVGGGAPCDFETHSSIANPFFDRFGNRRNFFFSIFSPHVHRPSFSMRDDRFSIIFGIVKGSFVPIPGLNRNKINKPGDVQFLKDILLDENDDQTMPLNDFVACAKIHLVTKKQKEQEKNSNNNNNNNVDEDILVQDEEDKKQDESILRQVLFRDEDIQKMKFDETDVEKVLQSDFENVTSSSPSLYDNYSQIILRSVGKKQTEENIDRLVKDLRSIGKNTTTKNGNENNNNQDKNDDQEKQEEEEVKND